MTRCRLMYGGLASALAVGVARLAWMRRRGESDGRRFDYHRLGRGERRSAYDDHRGPADAAPSRRTPPEELQGTWLPDFGGGAARLYIRGDRYAVSAGGSAQGDVVVDGAVIAFFNANGASCPPDPIDDVGRYRWKISDGKLRLKLLGDDSCAARISVMTDEPFERVG